MNVDLPSIVCSGKDIFFVCFSSLQAISKRDDLLRKSEGDLLQAKEGIKEKAAEAEHLDSVVKQLEERIQDAQKKMNQKEKENDVLRAEMKDLSTELQEVHKLYRETGNIAERYSDSQQCEGTACGMAYTDNADIKNFYLYCRIFPQICS